MRVKETLIIELELEGSMGMSHSLDPSISVARAVASALRLRVVCEKSLQPLPSELRSE